MGEEDLRLEVWDAGNKDCGKLMAEKGRGKNSITTKNLRETRARIQLEPMTEVDLYYFSDMARQSGAQPK